MEKFFRYFMLHETAIYTLVGSKPITCMSLFYQSIPEEELREQKREEYLYFLLNKNKKQDMQFYKTLSLVEKEEKAILVEDKNYIYEIEGLWEKWEQIQKRFALSQRFLLIKRERAPENWKEIFPDCKAIYDVFFVNVFTTALIIQENYELFKKAVGYDFDPLEVVFELEQEHSDFWNKLQGKEGWRYSTLWGLLYGFGRENAFSYYWKGRSSKESARPAQERLWAASLPSKSSCSKGLFPEDKNAFTMANFTIPSFKSFIENDPVVARYELEKAKIERLYQGKDFVRCTLDLLTEK